jgi:hypothetical protein
VSIIPKIPRPTIAPNRFAETPVVGSLFADASTVAIATARFPRLFSADQRFISEVRVDGTV